MVVHAKISDEIPNLSYFSGKTNDILPDTSHELWNQLVTFLRFVLRLKNTVTRLNTSCQLYIVINEFPFETQAFLAYQAERFVITVRNWSVLR